MFKNGYNFTYTDYNFFFHDQIQNIKTSELPLFLDFSNSSLGLFLERPLQPGAKPFDFWSFLIFSKIHSSQQDVNIRIGVCRPQTPPDRLYFVFFEKSYSRVVFFDKLGQFTKESLQKLQRNSNNK